VAKDAIAVVNPANGSVEGIIDLSLENGQKQQPKF
jgi:hypothetical protein